MVSSFSGAPAGTHSTHVPPNDNGLIIGRISLLMRACNPQRPSNLPRESMAFHKSFSDTLSRSPSVITEVLIPPERWNVCLLQYSNEGSSVDWHA